MEAIRRIQNFYIRKHCIRDGKNVEIPNGCDIKHLWRIESECTIVSAIIKVYSNCTDNIIINTYEDFCNSNCDIIILIYDYLFYEIYLKKEDDIFKIIKNADKHGCDRNSCKN